MHKFAAFPTLIPVLLCIALGLLTSARLEATSLGVTAAVSCPTVPPGGTAQITIALPSPIAFTHGTITVDLDPTVFGNISAVNVFSASGDQQGYATLQGLHAGAEFGASSGGIGRLPNMPMIEITAPVLSTARAGATGSVTVQSTAVWYEISGAEYNISFQSPGVLVGSGISIQSVVPGGGPTAAGTTVAINGLGLTKSTTLQLNGVAWSNLQFVSASQMTFTLTGAADLTGKLLVLRDTGGVTTQYYSSLTPTSVMSDNGNSGIWPIFPVSTYAGTGVEEQTGNFWLENDSAASIAVTFTPYPEECTPCAGAPLVAPKQVTLPAGGLYLASYAFNAPGSYPAIGTIITASAPIRALVAANTSPLLPTLGPASLSVYTAPVLDSDACPIDVIDYHKGDPAPAALACTIGLPFQSLTAGTADGTSWLHVSPSNGSSPQFTVSVDPTGLAEGSYSGVVAAALVPAAAATLYLLVPITLNVHAQTFIAVSASTYYFSPPLPSPIPVSVISTSPSVPITATTSAPWLLVTPTSGATPAQLSVSVLPSAPGDQTATLSVQGPGNTVQLSFYAESSTVLDGITDFTFTAALGSTTPLTNSLPAGWPFSAMASTSSGGSWLTTVAAPPASPATHGTLTILADPTGLAVGVYQGQVTVTPGVPVTEINATPVSVSLSVWDSSALPALSAPSSLQIDLSLSSGASFAVSSGTLSIPVSITTQSDSAVTLQAPSTGTTPGPFEVTAQTSFPGTFHGSITVTAPPNSTNSVVIPVTVTAPSIPAVDDVGPKISSIVNAASLLPGPISPGEIVSLFGLFPTPGTAGLAIGADGTVNRSHYAISVLFNGVAAPMLYLSAAQINAVAPYEVAGNSTVNVQVNLGGTSSPMWTLPVTPSSPGIFTQNGTGQGAGAILNQDSSLNTAQSPASRGSIVQIFLTGEGATNPPGITGEVTQSDIKAPIQQVTAQIGGVNAAVVSATTAPDAIAGLFQVNAIVPANAQTGAVSVVVQIGGGSSQAATIFVQ